MMSGIEYNYAASHAQRVYYNATKLTNIVSNHKYSVV
jgi:hypothetical protein